MPGNHAKDVFSSSDHGSKRILDLVLSYVWDVVPRPEGKSFVSSRRLHKIKHLVDGRIEKFKARFVARGFS